MKKHIFYTEISYVLGLIIMSFGAAFAELAGFGLSMVVAPTYALHLKLVEIFPWFSFGVAEYFVQALIIVTTALIVRRFKVSYLFSFITAIFYGTALDGAIYLLSYLPDDIFALRILWFVIGTLCCSLAVSLFFHTYLSPEAYELIVKEVSKRYSFNINKVKTAYDCISTLIAIILSFSFFGWFVFHGVGIGTIICALINGTIIGKISNFLDSRFEFKNKFNIQKWFE